MVLETNPFSLCCIGDKPLLLESRNKAKIEACFSTWSWLLLVGGGKMKDFRVILSSRAFQGKDCFQL